MSEIKVARQVFVILCLLVVCAIAASWGSAMAASWADATEEDLLVQSFWDTRERDPTSSATPLAAAGPGSGCGTGRATEDPTPRAADGTTAGPDAGPDVHIQILYVMQGVITRIVENTWRLHRIHVDESKQFTRLAQAIREGSTVLRDRLVTGLRRTREILGLLYGERTFLFLCYRSAFQSHQRACVRTMQQIDSENNSAIDEAASHLSRQNRRTLYKYLVHLFKSLFWNEERIRNLFNVEHSLGQRLLTLDGEHQDISLREQCRQALDRVCGVLGSAHGERIYLHTCLQATMVAYRRTLQHAEGGVNAAVDSAASPPTPQRAVSSSAPASSSSAAGRPQRRPGQY